MIITFFYIRERSATAQTALGRVGLTGRRA